MERRVVGRITLEGPEAACGAEPERRTAETLSIEQHDRQETRGNGYSGGGRRLLPAPNSVGWYVRRRADVVPSTQIGNHRADRRCRIVAKSLARRRARFFSAKTRQ